MEKNKIEKIVLSNGDVVSGQVFNFYDNGNPESIYFKSPIEINTSVGKLKFSNENFISLYENKELYCGLLERPAIIKILNTEILIKDSIVFFYENGKFMEGSLKEFALIETPIGKLNFRSEIMFYDNGKIKEGYLVSPKNISTPIGKYNFDFISFYENGKFQGGELKNSIVIKSSVGEIKGDAIKFYESGSIKEITAIDCDFKNIINTPIGKLNIKRNVKFYDNGNLKFCCLKKPSTIRTPMGKLKVFNISFYENGEFEKCVLAKTITINKVKYHKGDKINFDEQGNLTKNIKGGYYE